MMFWVLAAVLTVAATISLLVPLARTVSRQDNATEHDAEVYYDQLREIDRDIEAGLIAGEEAEYARAEVGRRLLKATNANAKSRPGSSLSSAARYVVIVFLPVMAVIGYLAIGKPGMPAQPLAARIQAPANDETDIRTLIAQAESHLASNPGDGWGWDVLAPIYLNLGRAGDAETAYRNAIRLLGSSASRQAGLGRALFAESGGIVTAEAQAAFQAAEDLEPGNPLSSFFLALGLAQEGNYAGAKAAFEKLAANSPPDAPWMPQVQAHLKGINANLAAAGEAAPGPDEEDVAAAMEMSPEDRMAMIGGMVDGLDARLRDNPDDLDGWLRLVRSYMVLGEPEKAGDALDRALLNFEDGSAGRLALTKAAEQFGLTPQRVE
ncbi:c-type cytochrome biogenesis protein CcmI [Hoeflea poritis]|uniref:C-type cytochrome biogenesis protein CcmI n=1 Tax=Hoeflea poritis TaxID=2993659 RepID=A0ABT4VTU0_9HYPH|nr:c-type cytochrome biogenesis protein CcmI [Hoeflea poritis]MDA4848128.1 c-type cytochrome biogenesis protein CcmI [Hoeflea poritis]